MAQRYIAPGATAAMSRRADQLSVAFCEKQRCAAGGYSGGRRTLTLVV
ncbi:MULTISPECIES: hypothetical protein [Pseudomonas]|nr:hypothetical protein [Pseudomonas sp. MIL9]MBM6442033.1 hypothetical protein [Pseudomonas sp. MIL9]